jgi:hypothetical protein
MATFTEILEAPGEKLINLLYVTAVDPKSSGRQKVRRAAGKLKLHVEQLICSLGFNPAIRELSDIHTALGFDSYEALANERNAIFIKDIYHRLSIDDIVAIYKAVKSQNDMIEVMQYLMASRLDSIEQRIDATVSPQIIERYKKEMRAIYGEGIAQIDFAESRLSKMHSGFRALINEVGIIVDTKIIPIGDIFFRDTVLPEEKRRLLNRGLVPIGLIRSRLEDTGISAQERRMLTDHLQLNAGIE